MKHDLIVIWKGFENSTPEAPWKEALVGRHYYELRVRDFGYDIRAYYVAARVLRHRYLCFLNSFSEALDPEWLTKLRRHIISPGVGAVGCTGSYESMLSNVWRDKGRARSLVARVWLWMRLFGNRAAFLPFPNPHLRTNAFLISRDLMNALWPAVTLTKRAAHRWESGRSGFSRQVLSRNLRVILVGRDGCAYDSADWKRSGVFRQGNQENLLMADNKTREYETAGYDVRRRLSIAAWGEDLSDQSGSSNPR